MALGHKKAGSGIIKFGTDGWRAKIADGFTFANLAKVTDAYAVWMKRGKKSPVIALGFDNRFMSDKYAAFAAERLASYGFTVKFFDKPVHTPMVSWSIVNKRLDSGIMITSSHNPYDYNGFKIKNKYGAGATSEQTKEVEKIIEKPEIPAKGRGIVEKVNYDAEYADAIRGVVDVPLIVKSGMKIVLDVMYGSGAGYFEKILAGYKGLRVIHSKRDPLFGGITPEPIRKNLLGLEEAVRAEKADIGIAIDGDGDRMALVDEKGNYLPTHKALVFLLLHHVKNRKARIKFVKTISGTSLLWKLAKEYGVDMEEVPVGFKHIAERMIKDRGVIGGEESGGVGFGYFVPERDGVLSNLMVLEFLAREGKNAGAVIRQLDKKYGPYMYDRVDLRFNEKDRENIVKSVNGLEKTGLIAGKKIASVSRLDGIKYILSDNEWILFRYSGTEPLLRIYSEAPSMKRVAENLAFGQRVAVRRRKRPHTQGNR